MTLLELNTYFKDLSLRMNDIKEFQTGSNYDIASNPSNKYPLVFFELPFAVDYPDFSKPKDTVRFSLSVFMSSKTDDIKSDVEAISFCKSIGDILLTKAVSEARHFIINAVNAVSVREFSDDAVAGYRYDITTTIIRDACSTDVNKYFKS